MPVKLIVLAGLCFAPFVPAKTCFFELRQGPWFGVDHFHNTNASGTTQVTRFYGAIRVDS